MLLFNDKVEKSWKLGNERTIISLQLKILRLKGVNGRWGIKSLYMNVFSSNIKQKVLHKYLQLSNSMERRLLLFPGTRFCLEKESKKARYSVRVWDSIG